VNQSVPYLLCAYLDAPSAGLTTRLDRSVVVAHSVRSAGGGNTTNMHQQCGHDDDGAHDDDIDDYRSSRTSATVERNFDMVAGLVVRLRQRERRARQTHLVKTRRRRCSRTRSRPEEEGHRLQRLCEDRGRGEGPRANKRWSTEAPVRTSRRGVARPGQAGRGLRRTGRG